MARSPRTLPEASFELNRAWYTLLGVVLDELPIRFPRVRLWIDEHSADVERRLARYREQIGLP